jgi:hypothetical protein
VTNEERKAALETIKPLLSQLYEVQEEVRGEAAIFMSRILSVSSIAFAAIAQGIELDPNTSEEDCLKVIEQVIAEDEF